MRTTPFTTEQLDAIAVLRADNRIQNERPCGCFDVKTSDTTFMLVLCDTCQVGLTQILRLK